MSTVAAVASFLYALGADVFRQGWKEKQTARKMKYSAGKNN